MWHLNKPPACGLGSAQNRTQPCPGPNSPFCAPRRPHAVGCACLLECEVRVCYSSHGKKSAKGRGNSVGGGRVRTGPTVLHSACHVQFAQVFPCKVKVRWGNEIGTYSFRLHLFCIPDCHTSRLTIQNQKTRKKTPKKTPKKSPKKPPKQPQKS